MSVIAVRDGQGYVISRHREYQLASESDVADLPKLDQCAVGSLAWLQDQSKIWMLGEDNEWHNIV